MRYRGEITQHSTMNKFRAGSGSKAVRIDPLCFHAGDRKKPPNLVLVFRPYIMHSVHNRRLVATDVERSMACVYACMSVSVSHRHVVVVPNVTARPRRPSVSIITLLC